MPIEYQVYEFDEKPDDDKVNALLTDLKLYNETEAEKLKRILGRINCNFSVVSEQPYVDKNFRDSYYIYHSRKFFLQNRDCVRLLLFENTISFPPTYSKEQEDKLNNQFIGFIIIQPIYSGLIGTNVIDPRYLGCSGCMCLGRFYCTVLGYTLSVNGFLHSSQNSETVTCAELTILGIVNTLAHISSEYKCITPSDIVSVKADNLYERVLPSKGLPYEIISQMLNRYAGSSRLYFLGKEDSNDKTEDVNNKSTKSESLRKLFHIYADSGLPLAVAVKGKDMDDSNIRHSVVCIGYEKRNYNWSNSKESIGNFSVINSYKSYDKYVLIDDNQPPYAVQSYNDFTIYKDSEIVGFVVPLPRSAFLEADEAYSIATEVLFEFPDTKIDESLIAEKYNYNKECNPLVIRLFLTSSAKYKRYKSKTLKSAVLINHLLRMNLPHYIWVMEVSTANLYSNNLAFGEVIIDATSSSAQHGIDSVILVHYNDRLGCVELINTFEYIMNDGKNRKRWGAFNKYNDIDESFLLFSNSDDY